MAQVGRPSKYKPEYCEEMIKFFSVDPTERRFKSEVSDEKGDKTTYEGGGVDFPSFIRFAFNIGVCEDTLNEWAKVHEEFSVATKLCKKLQEDIWLVNALNGNYSSQFSIFLGKNVFGYTDKQEIENTHTINQMPAVKLNGDDLAFNIGEAVAIPDNAEEKE